MRILLPVLVGAACGVLSGFGVGGGSLLMVWLTAAASVPQQTAQCYNLLYFLPTAGAALIFHARQKQILWRAVLPTAICGCAAAVAGALAADAVDPALLRKLFGGFLLLVGISELHQKKKSV